MLCYKGSFYYYVNWVYLVAREQWHNESVFRDGSGEKTKVKNSCDPSGKHKYSLSTLLITPVKTHTYTHT